MVRPPPAGASYWLCQVVGWTAYGLAVLALFGLTGTPVVPMAVHTVVYCSAGIGLTHLLRWRIHSRGWVAFRGAALAWRVVLGSLTLGFALVVVVAVSSIALIPGADRGPAIRTVWLWFNLSIVFFCWQLIYFVVHAVERARRVEIERWQLAAAARSAELRVLRGQLHPHFLFNCLNSVRALILIDPTKAQDMVTQLANILRYSLHSESSATVPFAQELQVVEAYLALEGVRLEERLRIRMDITPESLPVRVPAMMVQTLVENAIKHGVARHPSGGEVVVSSAVTQTALVVTVNSPLASGKLAESASEGEGVGLANARERLRLLFGDRAMLSLEAVDDGARATACLRIPLAT